jgi:hypothetical protein
LKTADHAFECPVSGRRGHEPKMPSSAIMRRSWMPESGVQSRMGWIAEVSRNGPNDQFDRTSASREQSKCRRAGSTLAVWAPESSVLPPLSKLESLARFAGTPMCRIAFLALIAASIAATWSDSQAAGSFQTKPAFQTTAVTAGVAPAAPSASAPSVSARDFVGGCGRGRVRDAQTHTCRGPADLR